MAQLQPRSGTGEGQVWAGVMARGVQTLARPHEDQGMSCTLLLALGVAQSGDSAALEPRTAQLPLPAPKEALERPPGPPPGVKDTGQGWKNNFSLLQA